MNTSRTCRNSATVTTFRRTARNTEQPHLHRARMSRGLQEVGWTGPSPRSGQLTKGARGAGRYIRYIVVVTAVAVIHLGALRYFW